jgi:hypothetical protein
VIQQDEFHPDPRVAARYADLNAALSARDYHSKIVKRLLTSEEPLTQSDEDQLQRSREFLAEAQKLIAKIGAELEDA